MCRTICADENLCIDDNIGFAKDRIISRLTEMQSVEYARSHAETHAPELLPSLKEKEQTTSTTTRPTTAAVAVPAIAAAVVAGAAKNDEEGP